MTIISRTSSWK